MTRVRGAANVMPSPLLSTITIEGNGATLLWDPDINDPQNARLFAIGVGSIRTPNGTASGTGSLTLRNVHVTGFHVKGGDGTNGGGGGLGGPGPYAMPGTYTVALVEGTKTLDSKPLKLGFDPDVKFAAGEHERYNAMVTDLHSIQRRGTEAAITAR